MLKFPKAIMRYIGILCFLLFFSCTKEDLSECDYYIQFRYDYNLASEDWFRDQVEEVKVYVFDTEGYYVQTLIDSIPSIALDGYKMKIPQAMKNYTAVVWAGRTESYNLSGMNVGDPIEKLELIYNPSELKSDLQIDNLWHNGPTKLLFSDGYGTTQSISLLRNTNDFYVQLIDTEGVSVLDDYQISITSANGSYQHTNQFLSDNEPISYLPYTNTNKVAKLRTLRLLENEEVIISIKDQKDQLILMGGKTEFDLIEYLLQSKPAQMSAQEYLDRCYIWDISLTLKEHLAISITINGWVTWFDNTEI